MALFVARVLADDAHHSFAADDAAGFAELLDGRTDFHGDGEGRKIEEVGTPTLRWISPLGGNKYSSAAPSLARRGRIRNTLRAVGKARCVFF